MKIIRNCILFLLFCGCLACNKEKIDKNKTTFFPIYVDKFSDDWTCSINPGEGANFTNAEFRLWVPDPKDVSKLKAVLVLLESYNGNGLSMANSKQWREYAITNNLALVGVYFATLPPSEEKLYSDARGASGRALLMALEAIAARNNISSVASLPFLLRGYSAGGQFSYYFSSFKPERTIAFASIRGWFVEETPSTNKSIPGLFLMEADTIDLETREMILNKRNESGLWAWAVEPGTDHYSSTNKSDSLIVKFFTAALKARTGTNSTELTTISEDSGWLGNDDTKLISSYATFPEDKKKAFWLIDETVAKAWVSYQKK